MKLASRKLLGLVVLAAGVLALAPAIGGAQEPEPRLVILGTRHVTAVDAEFHIGLIADDENEAANNTDKLNNWLQALQLVNSPANKHLYEIRFPAKAFYFADRPAPAGVEYPDELGPVAIYNDAFGVKFVGSGGIFRVQSGNNRHFGTRLIYKGTYGGHLWVENSYGTAIHDLSFWSSDDWTADGELLARVGLHLTKFDPSDGTWGVTVNTGKCDLRNLAFRDFEMGILIGGPILSHDGTEPVEDQGAYDEAPTYYQENLPHCDNFTAQNIYGNNVRTLVYARTSSTVDMEFRHVRSGGNNKSMWIETNGTVKNGTGTTTGFTANEDLTDDNIVLDAGSYIEERCLVTFTSGDAMDQTRMIKTFNDDTNEVTFYDDFDDGELSVAPSDGSSFKVTRRSELFYFERGGDVKISDIEWGDMVLLRIGKPSWNSGTYWLDNLSMDGGSDYGKVIEMDDTTANSARTEIVVSGLCIDNSVGAFSEDLFSLNKGQLPGPMFEVRGNSFLRVRDAQQIHPNWFLFTETGASKRPSALLESSRILWLSTHPTPANADQDEVIDEVNSSGEYAMRFRNNRYDGYSFSPTPTHGNFPDFFDDHDDDETDD